MVGVDEAGRGPLAGPVVAAAVVLSGQANLEGLNDSKKVSPRRREILYKEIEATCRVGIGLVDEKQIDILNIYQASRLAMKKAVLSLACVPAFLLIDGRIVVDLPIPQKGIVGGDHKSAAIAAASIVAKVYRDAYMEFLDHRYPVYGFRRHKGYPTRRHIQKILDLGPCPVHRRSFSPVNAVLQGLRK